MNKENDLKRVTELLSYWLTQIYIDKAISSFDFIQYSEGLSVKLLNIIYNYNLVVESGNLGVMDLSDETAGVAFRVTTSPSLVKIRGCFEEFYKRKYEVLFPQGFRFLILSLEESAIDRLKRVLSFKELYPNFDPARDIIGPKEIINAIEHLYDADNTRFIRVLNLLEEEIGGIDKQKSPIIPTLDVPEYNLDGLLEMQKNSYPAMALKRLTLNNIKCFQHVKLDFQRNVPAPSWTVLVGDNGVGKTTILHAIALCALGPELASKSIPFPHNMVRIGADSGYMETVFVIATENNPETELTIRLNIKKGSKTFEIAINGDVEKAELLKKFIAARNFTGFDGWFVAGYGAVRNLLFTDEPSQSTRQDIVIDRVSSLFNPTKILIDPASLYRFLAGDTSPFKELGAPSRLNQETIDNVRTLLDKLLPMIHFLETNGTETLATDFGNVPISELSEGYKSMLSWLTHLIVHLLRAVRWDGRIDAVKGIVLIDEVDLHLHPGWQQEVIPLLRESFPHLQFIGCTHSPMTVGGVDDGDIILLQRHGNAILAEQELPSIKGWRADQILTSLIFGLKTSRDKKTQDEIEEYKTLISLANLLPEQEVRLQYLRTAISDTLPASGETEIQREAFRIITETQKEYFMKQAPEKKQALLEEIKRQLQQ